MGSVSLAKDEIKAIEMLLASSSLSATVAENLAELSTNLENILVCAQHQKVIADDVLGLSKLEQNRVALDRTPFHLVQCIKEAVSMYNASLKLKKLTLNMHLDVEPKYEYVKGDPFRLRQIIANILANAIKFTERGGVTIYLRVHEVPDDGDESPRDTSPDNDDDGDGSEGCQARRRAAAA